MNMTPEESSKLHAINDQYTALMGKAVSQGLPPETAEELSTNRAALFQHLLLVDGRFDLPNEAALYKAAEQIVTSKRGPEFGCIAFNIRDFKKINKIVGPYAANDILDAFLTGLVHRLGPEDQLFTGGQDDGYIICRTEQIDMFLDYLHCTTVTYNSEKPETMEIRCAVGCNRCIGDIQIHFMIMDTVSVPLKLARQNRSRAQWCVFWDDNLSQKSSEEAWITGIIPKALQNNEFQVYYQPKVNLKNYVLAGAEALCRWPHEGKMIYPDQFIPLMEKSGTIGELDFYMLDHACADIARWLAEGLTPVQISVNLSRVNMESESLLDRIIHTVDRHDIPHTYIQIELTETATDVGFQELKDLMEGLRDAGFSTAIDDFGTGYSSMSLIKNLPWNVIKIDKSLLHEHTDPKQDKHLMFKAIAHMVQTLGLEAVVEGVETIEDINLMKENDCALAQGYFFDKPLPLADFEKRLKDAQG